MAKKKRGAKKKEGSKKKIQMKEKTRAKRTIKARKREETRFIGRAAKIRQSEPATVIEWPRSITHIHTYGKANCGLPFVPTGNARKTASGYRPVRIARTAIRKWCGRPCPTLS
jgi:hypothetical protein